MARRRRTKVFAVIWSRCLASWWIRSCADHRLPRETGRRREREKQRDRSAGLYYLGRAGTARQPIAAGRRFLSGKKRSVQRDAIMVVDRGAADCARKQPSSTNGRSERSTASGGTIKRQTEEWENGRCEVEGGPEGSKPIDGGRLGGGGGSSRKQCNSSSRYILALLVATLVAPASPVLGISHPTHSQINPIRDSLPPFLALFGAGDSLLVHRRERKGTGLGRDSAVRASQRRRFHERLSPAHVCALRVRCAPCAPCILNVSMAPRGARNRW